jgi:hypothetical protein
MLNTGYVMGAVHGAVKNGGVRERGGGARTHTHTQYKIIVALHEIMNMHVIVACTVPVSGSAYNTLSSAVIIMSMKNNYLEQLLAT